MNNIKVLINKSSVATSLITLSALLMISACSDKTATDAPAVNAPETAVVEAPVTVEAVEETAAVIEAPAADTATATTAEPELLAVDAGAKLYESNCKVCHDNGLLNSPKLGDKEAWAPRIAKGKDTLHMHSAKGFNKMPAQAANGVTEAQVYAAVDYMIAAAS